MLYNTKQDLYWWGKPYTKILFLSDQSLLSDKPLSNPKEAGGGICGEKSFHWPTLPILTFSKMDRGSFWKGFGSKTYGLPEWTKKYTYYQDKRLFLQMPYWPQMKKSDGEKVYILY